MSIILLRVGRNVFSSWASYAVNMIVSFFMVPFVVHTLGNAGYGIWVLVGSLTGFLGLLDLGLRPTVTRFIAKYKALDDDLMVNRVANVILMILTAVAALVVLASLVLAFFSEELFKVPAEFHGQFRLVLIITGINIAAGFPFSVFGAMLAAIERFDLYNAVSTAVFLARTAVLVLTLKLGGGLVAMGVVVLFSGMTEFLLKARLCFTHIPALELSPRFANRDTFKLVTAFSGYAFITNIAGRISFQSDAVILGAMISAEAITIYTVGSTMLDYLMNLIFFMSNAVMPLASTLDAKNDFSKLRELLIVGTKYCVAVILPISFGYLVLGSTFISLWMGPDFGPTSGKVLTILTCGFFGYLSQLVAVAIFVGLGKVRFLAYLNVGLAFLNVALSIFFVRLFGVYGSALGTAIPLVIMGAIVYPIYICRVLSLKFSAYIAKSYLGPFLWSLPFLAIILASNVLIQITSFLRFFAVVATASLAHAAVFFWGVLEPAHRRTILQRVKAL